MRSRLASDGVPTGRWRRVAAPVVGAAILLPYRRAEDANATRARFRHDADTMSNTSLGRFRAIAFWEGISFLVLLLIAMPVKYGLGMPQGVRVVGMIHGVLFVAYVLALVHAAFEHRWGPKRVTIAFLASLVPGGTFWLDAQLRREAAAVTAVQPTR